MRPLLSRWRTPRHIHAHIHTCVLLMEYSTSSRCTTRDRKREWSLPQQQHTWFMKKPRAPDCNHSTPSTVTTKAPVDALTTRTSMPAGAAAEPSLRDARSTAHSAHNANTPLVIVERDGPVMENGQSVLGSFDIENAFLRISGCLPMIVGKLIYCYCAFVIICRKTLKF